MTETIALNLLNHWHSCIEGAQTEKQKEILSTKVDEYIAKLHRMGVNVELDVRSNEWNVVNA